MLAPKSSESKMLRTMQEICDYYGRSEQVIMRLIKEDNFPAVKIVNRWESNKDLIDAYQRRAIERRLQANGSGQ